MSTCGKNVFLAESHARNGAVSRLKRNDKLPGVWYYRCPDCSRWHLAQRAQSDLNHFVSRFTLEKA